VGRKYESAEVTQVGAHRAALEEAAPEVNGQAHLFLPPAMIPAFAVLMTGLEILFGLLFLAGWFTRKTAVCSGVHLFTFHDAGIGN
jgi:uncharacterized membrane protein YphA (DoxX/SURF4 family)